MEKSLSEIGLHVTIRQLLHSTTAIISMDMILDWFSSHYRQLMAGTGVRWMWPLHSWPQGVSGMERQTWRTSDQTPSTWSRSQVLIMKATASSQKYPFSQPRKKVHHHTKWYVKVRSTHLFQKHTRKKLCQVQESPYLGLFQFLPTCWCFQEFGYSRWWNIVKRAWIQNIIIHSVKIPTKFSTLLKCCVEKFCDFTLFN